MWAGCQAAFGRQVVEYIAGFTVSFHVLKVQMQLWLLPGILLESRLQLWLLWLKVGNLILGIVPFG